MQKVLYDADAAQHKPETLLAMAPGGMPVWKGTFAMNPNYIYALAIGIGIVAGLRAFTAPALVSWAAHLGWLNLHGSPLSFMGSTVAVAIFSLGAVFEYVNDKLPRTRSRTAPPSLIVRIVLGGLC